jgi:hypothetical protein
VKTIAITKAMAVSSVFIGVLPAGLGPVSSFHDA